jgi:hypothetical protein
MIDEKVLEVIRKNGDGVGGVDEWIIASFIYPWDEDGMRPKHGAWINQVIRACCRLQEKGLVGSYMVSHGCNASGTRVWFAKRVLT